MFVMLAIHFNNIAMTMQFQKHRSQLSSDKNHKFQVYCVLILQ